MIKGKVSHINGNHRETNQRSWSQQQPSDQPDN